MTFLTPILFASALMSAEEAQPYQDAGVRGGEDTAALLPQDGDELPEGDEQPNITASEVAVIVAGGMDAASPERPGGAHPEPVRP